MRVSFEVEDLWIARDRSSNGTICIWDREPKPMKKLGERLIFCRPSEDAKYELIDEEIAKLLLGRIPSRGSLNKIRVSLRSELIFKGIQESK